MTNVDIGRYSKRLVQLIWNPEPKNDDIDNSPIWCLGRRYNGNAANPSGEKAAQQPDEQSNEPPTASHSSSSRPTLGSRNTRSSFEHVLREDVAHSTAVNGVDDGWPEDFLHDFETRIWLTYRSNFPAIPKSPDPKATASMSLSVRLKSQLSNQAGFTSDTGWGCMIRSGQSLLANSMLLQKMGRDWRISPAADFEERKLLSLFADDPQAPFSVHKFVEHGATACGTYPGQWFGPSATAKCIEALCNNFALADLRVYVTGDGPDVFESVLLDIAKRDTADFHPTLLLVGTRLGIDRITPVYKDALVASLMMPQSVGIAGGRPSSSHYFIGVQGNNFFYLDPHQTQPALVYHQDPATYSEDEIKSCHTRRLRRLPLNEMDPSMLIGFLFQNEQEWKSWRDTVSAAPGRHIFHVADSPPSLHGQGIERESALDEVEILDDEDQERQPED